MAEIVTMAAKISMMQSWSLGLPEAIGQVLTG
jgi:hypothetical protein